MNLHDSLQTANWLLEREIIDGEPAQILAIRKMRDNLYLLHAAAGITEIVINVIEEGTGFMG